MKFTSDIDIDFGDRELLLSKVRTSPASIDSGGVVKKHNTGVYPTVVPVNPLSGLCSLDYRVAESRGYIKLDLLNVWVYKHVKDARHLEELLKEPEWSLLHNKDFFEKLIHLGNHWSTYNAMPEPVNSIPRLAMLLALIRPGKRHLIGCGWKEVAATIWEPGTDGYTFKKSHSIAYAHLVVVHMNLLAAGLL